MPNPEIIVYSKANCPYCDRAKQLLDSRGLPYQEIRVDLDSEQLAIMLERSQRRTVPQIFINGHHVGGFDDLSALSEKHWTTLLAGD